MQPAAAQYLAKRAHLDRWPLQSGPLDDVDTVVAIPCLAEHESLFATLDSLSNNDPALLQRTLVICVVNNRAPQFARAEDIANNRETLRDLDAARRDDALGGVRLAIVDAASPGRELSEKDGVGMARKIGLDWGVSLLDASGNATQILCSLDADTLVEPNYLEAVRTAFSGGAAWAGVVHFEHVLPEDPAHREAIVEYECFLRCHVHGLRLAESPYAFHTVGSTMACTPNAYVAVSGMNRRQAAEDFYFLQQLAKTGLVVPITSTTVFPSARVSHRVPFGTGRSMSEAFEGSRKCPRIYNPASYEIVRQCLHIPSIAVDGSTVLDPHPELHAFLEDNAFDDAWQRIRAGAGSARQRTRQFHTWCDAFRTMKLLHRLRDHGYPNVNAEDAARAWNPASVDAESFLMELRKWDRATGGMPLGLHA